MKYDKTILNNNIKKLMKENSMSQNALSEAISKTVSLHQSRISACFNEDTSESFTLEQIVAIADFFKVSVDSLLGVSSHEMQKQLTARDICKLIATIINNTDVSLQNDTYDQALIFPELYGLTESQKEHDINRHINKFLERMFDLCEIRTKGNINSEMFSRLVESYLSDVPEAYYMTDWEIFTKYPKQNNYSDIEIN